mgnify:FL=1
MNTKEITERLFRIIKCAGYSSEDVLTIPVEELVEIPGITVPNIRTILYLQNKYRSGELGIIIKRGEKRHGR